MRVNVVLMLLVLASAIYLVGIQHESRLIKTELEEVNKEATRLQLENDRLQAEKHSQSTPARVERLAREKLQMHQASVSGTTYVTYTTSKPETDREAKP